MFNFVPVNALISQFFTCPSAFYYREKKTCELCMPDSSTSKFFVRNIESKGKVKDWVVEGKKLFISFHWLVCFSMQEGVEDG